MPTLVLTWTLTDLDVYFSRAVVVSVSPNVLTIHCKSWKYFIYFLDHAPGTSVSAPLAVPSTSRQPTPSAEGKGLNGSLNGTGTSTPTSVKPDSTIYFDCQNCQRPVCLPVVFYSSDGLFFCTLAQVASNRYAPHLSSCMGIGTGTRRVGNRLNAKTKYVYSCVYECKLLIEWHRTSADAGRSQSPYVVSENGAQSDGDSPNPTKGKVKAKAKRGGRSAIVSN